MRLKDIITEMPFGSVRGPGFGGNGRGDFTQKYYAYIASHLFHIHDPDIKEFLTNWFVDVFKQDNPKFKEAYFRQVVERGAGHVDMPMFQQRHFYYLAQKVSEVQDMHVRQWLTDWLGDMFNQSNSDFRMQRWRKFCGMELTPDEEKVVNPRRSRHGGRRRDEDD